jgi:hypothetical protein
MQQLQAKLDRLNLVRDIRMEEANMSDSTSSSSGSIIMENFLQDTGTFVPDKNVAEPGKSSYGTFTNLDLLAQVCDL